MILVEEDLCLLRGPLPSGQGWGMINPWQTD